MKLVILGRTPGGSRIGKGRFLHMNPTCMIPLWIQHHRSNRIARSGDVGLDIGTIDNASYKIKSHEECAAITFDGRC